MAVNKRKVVRILSGLGLIVLGLIGGILPVLPGWVFMLFGLSMLFPNNPKLKKARRWTSQKVQRFKRRASHSLRRASSKRSPDRGIPLVTRPGAYTRQKR